jgi:ferredoxin-nitrite reductase
MFTEMNTPALPSPPETAGGFSPEQKNYLEGFFAGIKAKGVSFTDLAVSPAAPAAPALDLDSQTKEERIKRELHPFDAYPQLLEDARHNAAPEPEMLFRHKWNGLFWLNPVKDGYMCRLRIPGGFVQSYQARRLAAIVEELTTGYLQITTRNNFQIRVIQPKDAPEVLRRIQMAGLHSRGAGADNIRNITANPTAGIDPHELIDVSPLVHDLAQTIISTREFYNLPRKFNIALDGGGLIGTVEDTNDIGLRAVRINPNSEGIPEGVYFRLALGGVTGHQTFARDAGVLITPGHALKAILAILRVFIRDGDRTSRKKARLKYLIESRGLTPFVEDCEALLGFKLPRLDGASPLHTARTLPDTPHSHVGVFPQKQPGLFYIGASVPVGQMTAKQLARVADLAENYGSGEVRLTVWQNFILPNIPEAYVATVCKQLTKLGFDTIQSHLKSGFVACTGSRYCKFAASDTKGHALELMRHLDKRVKLDQPVNIHLTGCAHSCAQHYMGDIGLLGTKVKTEDGSVEGYHVCVGGGFAGHQAVGRQIFTGIAFDELKGLLERMLKSYLAKRQEKESFQTFCNRHEVGRLQEIFTNEA